jgi:hypothetical protein
LKLYVPTPQEMQVPALAYFPAAQLVQADAPVANPGSDPEGQVRQLSKNVSVSVMRKKMQ